MLTKLWNTLVAHRRAANDRKTTINELSRLTNKELNDIGLSRCDIWYLAEQHYQSTLEATKRELEVKRELVGHENTNLRGWV